MGYLSDTLQLVIQLLNDPFVRALATLIAATSLVISILALRRTSLAMVSHVSGIRSEQARFLESQWSKLNSLTISNADCARLLAESFGIEGEMEAKREVLHYMFLNILASAFIAWKNGVADFEVYDGHMGYFFSCYKGSPDYLIRLIEVAHYPPEFLEECRKRLQNRTFVSTQP